MRKLINRLQRRTRAADELGLEDLTLEEAKEQEEEDREVYSKVEFDLTYNVAVKDGKGELTSDLDDRMNALVKLAFDGTGDHQAGGVDLVFHVLAKAIATAMRKAFKDVGDLTKDSDKPYRYVNIKHRYPKQDAASMTSTMNCSGEYANGQITLHFVTKLSGVVFGKDEAQEAAENLKGQLAYVDAVQGSIERRLNDTYRKKDTLFWDDEKFEGIETFKISLAGLGGVILSGQEGGQVTASRRRGRVLARFRLTAGELARARRRSARRAARRTDRDLTLPRLKLMLSRYANVEVEECDDEGCEACTVRLH